MTSPRGHGGHGAGWAGWARWTRWTRWTGWAGWGRWNRWGRRTRTFVVIAKNPVPGRVKTRLHTRPGAEAGFTPGEAAQLAAAALADTLDAVDAVGAVGAVGALGAVGAARGVRRLLVLDGDPSAWRDRPVEIVPQTGGGLDERLEGAFAQAFARGPGPVLLVGMDTPQITPELLDVRWWGADAVLGPSEDGGYWAVGLRRPAPGAFRGVPMSTSRTGAAQLARLRSLGLRVRLLPSLRDVDRPDDAAAVAALAPSTGFARAYDRILAGRPRPSAVELFDAGLERVSGRGSRIVRARTTSGADLDLDLPRWNAPADGTDRLLLSRCEPPVLDLGCGPGRLVAAVAESGAAALGVDISPAAVRLTAGRGASVLRRAVEHPLPGAGRWGTVLLADGNLGIGGDPERLLRRCFDLLRPGGLLLVETDPDDALDTRERLVLVDDLGRRSHPVPWARQGSRALTRVGEGAGFVVSEEWRTAGRVFLALRRPGVSLRALDA